jgi:protein subunit release factor A
MRRADALIADPASDSEMRGLAEAERAESEAELEKLDHDCASRFAARCRRRFLGHCGNPRRHRRRRGRLFAADLLEMYQRYCGCRAGAPK